MNLIADAMEPYLRANTIRFTRNSPDMTAASSIAQAAGGQLRPVSGAPLQRLRRRLHRGAAAGDHRLLLPHQPEWPAGGGVRLPRQSGGGPVAHRQHGGHRGEDLPGHLYVPWDPILAPDSQVDIDPEPVPDVPESDTIYRVQVGAFKVKGNADAYLAKVREIFPEAYITAARV